MEIEGNVNGEEKEMGRGKNIISNYFSYNLRGTRVTGCPFLT